jgi:phosphotransferase system enzyme I (PtsI)
LLNDVSDGDFVIVDGDHGRVIVAPDEPTLKRYEHEVEEHRSQALRLEELRDLPATTNDGVHVSLQANIEFPWEVEACLERGAEGIGLYRTEFLYLGAANEPTEAEHFSAYDGVVRQMQGRPVCIRTLDLGADKLGQLPTQEEERNPFLGLRSVRLSLKNVPLFRTQLRAILRASAHGSVRVMFPLIATLQELRQCKMVLADAIEDLEEAGLELDRSIEVGMMVEVPAAVVMLDRFLPEVDFISIGTNDLVQYTLAVDRSNKEVADRYRASDPAVLRFLEMSLSAAQDANVSVSVCGQMGGEPLYTMLLLGLGLRAFSVPPSTIPEIKNVCRHVSISECQQVARHVLALDNAWEIETYLREQLRKVVPELACS